MDDYADQIKKAVTMHEVVLHYGFTMTHNHKIKCPFHDDNKPSLHIYPKNKGWYCFVCGEGGSSIDFVMKLFNLDFHDAIRKMNDDFRVGIPMDSNQSEKDRKEAERKLAKIRAERKARENERKRLWTIYHAAMDKYTALDLIIRDEAPAGPYDDVSYRFQYACQHIDAAWQEVEEAESKLYEYEQKER